MPLPPYSANHSRFCSSTRPRQRARRRDGDLERRVVAPADAAAAELQLIEVVLVIGGHAIGPNLLAGGRLGRTRIIELAGRQIEPIVEVILLIVGPHLAVDVRIGRRHHRGLCRGRNPFLREREHRDLVRLAIYLGDGGLIHHRQPDIAVGVELEIEAAFRLLGPHHRDRNVLGRSVLRVHDAHELCAEIRVPNLPILIDDDGRAEARPCAADRIP